MVDDDIVQQLVQKVEQLVQKIEHLKHEKSELQNEFKNLRIYSITQIRLIDAKIEDPEKRQILKKTLTSMLREHYGSFTGFAEVDKGILKRAIQNVLREIFKDGVMKNFRLIKYVRFDYYYIKKSTFFLCLRETLTEKPFNFKEEEAKNLVHKAVKGEYTDIRNIVNKITTIFSIISLIVSVAVVIYSWLS